ncbi:hypothetical protein [Aurantiacibacter zhengii]|uniref:Uncharacterized protein n=1 Tax=Aurantiacibacter zhengii TaxID=2307003 RepID=A0A418NNV1_9SPHN|nr:hypothetical protein [Aurantiacibacter zhengii]RIV83373.1 hypothetical protein D2V07_16625 [Aurantiacibacter zhengii]
MTYIGNNWHPQNGYASMLAQAATSAITNLSADRTEWDKRLADYLRLQALSRAWEEYGAPAKLREASDRIELDLEFKFGRNWRKDAPPKALAEWETAIDRVVREEEQTTERFYRPLWKAQVALANTPAPDLAAALFKVEMIERDEVWNDRDLSGDAFEIVAQDMARLAGEAA